MPSELYDQDPPDRLLEALRRAPMIPETEIDRYVHSHRDITDSELMVLRCLSVGMTVEMAAVALGKTYLTVQNQCRHARYKLRAKNSTHAVAVAMREGLIP